MRYEFAVILSNIASAIALLPKFSCHPCGINCEANIVEWVLYLNSNNSKISDCCSEVDYFTVFNHSIHNISTSSR